MEKGSQGDTWGLEHLSSEERLKGLGPFSVGRKDVKDMRGVRSCMALKAVYR